MIILMKKKIKLKMKKKQNEKIITISNLTIYNDF